MNWPESYLGIPWVTGGRDACKGLDCWGLLRYIYFNEFKIDLPEYAFAPGALTPPTAIKDGELVGDKWQETDKPELGDVIACGNKQGFYHVGIYVDTVRPAVLHIMAGRTARITSITDMRRVGFSQFKYYRHADRIHN